MPKYRTDDRRAVTIGLPDETACAQIFEILKRFGSTEQSLIIEIVKANLRQEAMTSREVLVAGMTLPELLPLREPVRQAVDGVDEFERAVLSQISAAGSRDLALDEIARKIPAKPSLSVFYRIARILKAQGWIKKRVNANGKRGYVYCRLGN
jgi:hypothetical protein